MHEASGHAGSSRTYYAIFGALLVLTGVTVAVAFWNLGRLNDVVALAIAGFKAALVILYFMHVRHASNLTKVFVAAGFFWLVLLFVFTFSDLLTRVY